MKYFALIFLIVAFSLSCKKNTKGNDTNNSNNPDSIQWTIMSNPTDPLLAIAKSDTSQILFYGKRDAVGTPISLTNFIIEKRTDTLYYSLDSVGRPLIIQNSNGVQIKYDWQSANQANISVTSADGQYEIKAPVTASRLNSIHNGSKLETPNNVTSGNITINITNCGEPYKSNIGDVWINLRLAQGDQDISIIPTDFINGAYSASLPIAVPGNLIPLPDYCQKIADVIDIACKVNDIAIDQGGEQILQYGCIALSSALLLSPLSAPYIVEFQAACIAATEGFSLYCSTINQGNNLTDLGETICNAKYIKRIYDHGIYLQPYVTYKGVKINGVEISTIGGSQQIDLDLNIDDCNAKLITSAILSVTSTTAVSGGNITDDGGTSITSRGVCWSTSQNPTILNNKTTDGAGTGSFTSLLTGLNSNTTYYVKAYASNSSSTAYGNEVSFTTLTMNDSCDLSFTWGPPPSLPVQEGTHVFMPSNIWQYQTDNETFVVCTPINGSPPVEQLLSVGIHFKMKRGDSATITMMWLTPTTKLDCGYFAGPSDTTYITKTFYCR
jgi:hypothetical protein